MITKKSFRDLSVGETFNLGVHKLKVKETEKPCKDCYMLESFWIDFCEDLCNTDFIPECIGHKRKDKKTVVFVKVEE